MTIANVLHKTITGTLFAVTLVGVGYICVGTVDLIDRRNKRNAAQEKAMNEFFETQTANKQALKKQQEENQDD
ncbi:hypothetical protein SAMD00019534_038420 [Acytostelium subglobosum LB1]|uniref:hypothetical protein n=1 Tax=Acytostelium subglobosum LB1 TaxID=1410327 RepID=UPI000644E164|nr:hypothetical protein SAMD00019534_038420 [Acytostelium subglobosum LB1]GAM20667.1 hypothetical protein SAMD00019534_038420 [Acytostelium subglobosum LB1]|eukprot:XP_012760188.1 hypothetical protein SAMD00019534_038420 [Acytostelium subglobosum LB1]